MRYSLSEIRKKALPKSANDGWSAEVDDDVVAEVGVGGHVGADDTGGSAPTQLRAQPQHSLLVIVSWLVIFIQEVQKHFLYNLDKKK